MCSCQAVVIEFVFNEIFWIQFFEVNIFARNDTTVPSGYDAERFKVLALPMQAKQVAGGRWDTNGYKCFKLLF